MRKIMAFLFLVALLGGCGGGSDTKSEESGEKDITKDPDYQKGLELVSKSNCFTCHKIDEKSIGPAYREIANKHKSTSDKTVSELADRVTKGSVGVWGDVPMPARADIPEADAKAMVRYILLLKN